VPQSLSDTFIYLLRPVNLGARDPSSTASLCALSLSLCSTADRWSLMDLASDGSHVLALKPVTSSFRLLAFLPDEGMGRVEVVLG
jgi:hypothetical protein